jgi:rfaE bifunctional protein kinase chain/domain
VSFWTMRKRALVVGDLMLDVFTQGEASRLSPEAPVPVVLQQQCRRAAGGAGNAAANLALLGDHVSVVAAVGNDQEGRQLRSILDGHGVDTSAVLMAPGTTPQKHRVVANGQHLVRLDVEDPELVSPEVAAACAEQARKLVSSVDVVLISDYGKGICTPDLCAEVIHQAGIAGVPVVVDPKGTNYERYRGAAVITPNLAELYVATGAGPVQQRARSLAHSLASAVLVTRGADGMSLFTAEGPELHLPTQAKTVRDVTGAGDTVASVLAAGLAREISLGEVCRIANACAGVTVGQLGTAPITKSALRKIGDARERA